jgi:hypothetical protein
MHPIAIPAGTKKADRYPVLNSFIRIMLSRRPWQYRILPDEPEKSEEKEPDEIGTSCGGQDPCDRSSEGTYAYVLMEFSVLFFPEWLSIHPVLFFQDRYDYESPQKPKFLLHRMLIQVHVFIPINAMQGCMAALYAGSFRKIYCGNQSFRVFIMP